MRKSLVSATDYLCVAGFCTYLVSHLVSPLIIMNGSHERKMDTTAKEYSQSAPSLRELRRRTHTVLRTQHNTPTPQRETVFVLLFSVALRKQNVYTWGSNSVPEILAESMLLILARLLHFSLDAD